MNKKNIATTALAFSVAGAAGTSFIASGSFLGGMIHNGFLAASIGGLADWFAVTALFRKPLGISYRTQILVRNRQRLMEAIIEFAAGDLLSVDHIMQFVDKQDSSRLLQQYLTGNGRQRALQSFDRAIAETAKLVDTRALTHEIMDIIAELLKGKTLERLTENITTAIACRATAEGFLPILIQLLRNFMADKDVQMVLKVHLGQMLKKYEGQGAGRAFVLGLVDLTDERLLDILNNKLDNWLIQLEQHKNMEDATESVAASVEDVSADRQDDEIAEDNDVADDDSWEHLVSLLEMALQSLVNSQGFKNTIDSLVNNVIFSDKLEAELKSWLDEQLNVELAVADGDQAEPIQVEQLSGWQKLVHELADNKLIELSQDEVWLKKVDRWLKLWIKGQLEQHHEIIPDMIRDRLDELSDEELVTFAESKVNDDLQMIRINGSVVGGMAGMALYCIAFIVGQVLSR